MFATAQDGQAFPASIGSRRHPCGGAGTIGSSRPRLQLAARPPRALCLEALWPCITRPRRASTHPLALVTALRVPLLQLRHVPFHLPSIPILLPPLSTAARYTSTLITLALHPLRAARVGNTSDSCVIARITRVKSKIVEIALRAKSQIAERFDNHHLP